MNHTLTVSLSKSLLLETVIIRINTKILISYYLITFIGIVHILSIGINNTTLLFTSFIKDYFPYELLHLICHFLEDYYPK